MQKLTSVTPFNGDKLAEIRFYRFDLDSKRFSDNIDIYWKSIEYFQQMKSNI